MILIAYYEKECWVIQNCIDFVVHALDKLGIPYEYTHGHDVLKNFNKDKHNLVLVLHPTSQIVQDVAQYAQIPVKKVWWDFEAPYEIDTIAQNMWPFEMVITHCKNSAEYLNSPIVKWLPTASDTTIFYPNAASSYYHCDFLFIGNAFPTRIQHLKDIADKWKDKKSVVIGVGYPQEIKDIYMVIDKITSPTECAKWYNGAKHIETLQRTVDDADLGQNKNKIKPNLVPIRNMDILACKSYKDYIFSVDEDKLYEISFEKLVKENILPLL